MPRPCEEEEAVEELQEIKSEDIEADIAEPWCEPALTAFSPDCKLGIVKRKPQYNSDSEEESSSSDGGTVACRETEVVPLKKRQRMQEMPYATGHAVNKVPSLMNIDIDSKDASSL